MSLDKDGRSNDTTECFVPYLFAYNKSEARLIKTQVILPYWTYLLTGAWVSKSCISLFFALTNGAWKTTFLNYLNQIHFIDTTDQIIPFIFSWNSS